MAHAHARLTQFGRLLLVQRITELGWPPAQAAEAVGVSRATAYKWLARYRQHGMAGLADRSSRPYRCPHALPAAQVRRVLAARRRRRQGPHRLGYHLGMARSTIYGTLRRHHMSRLAHTDRTSGAVVRYQRERPGELVHLDVKKLGRIPNGGGHRAHGRAKGARGRGIGYDDLHSAVDNRSRVACSQLLPDETGPNLRSVPGRGGRLLRRARGADRASADRQRQGLCRVGRLRRDRRRTRDPAQAHPPLPPSDQRQGRALQPHLAGGVGLCPAVALQ